MSKACIRVVDLFLSDGFLSHYVSDYSDLFVGCRDVSLGFWLMVLLLTGAAP